MENGLNILKKELTKKMEDAMAFAYEAVMFDLEDLDNNYNDIREEFLTNVEYSYARELIDCINGLQYKILIINTEDIYDKLKNIKDKRKVLIETINNVYEEHYKDMEDYINTLYINLGGEEIGI